MPSALSGLMELAEARIQGPSPTFGRAHFLLAFMTIGANGAIGRGALAREAGLGEGATRTVLKRMRDGGYANADASGCHLTPRGTEVYLTLKRKLSGPLRLEGSRLTVGRVQAAVAVRDAARAVRRGIEQRDSAVMAGAAGATTYVVRGGRFAMPAGSSDCEADFPSPAWARLRSELGPQEGDVVILCGSSDGRGAALGALSAALTLI